LLGVELSARWRFKRVPRPHLRSEAPWFVGVPGFSHRLVLDPAVRRTRARL